MYILQKQLSQNKDFLKFYSRKLFDIYLCNTSAPMLSQFKNLNMCERNNSQGKIKK